MRGVFRSCESRRAAESLKAQLPGPAETSVFDGRRTVARLVLPWVLGC